MQIIQITTNRHGYMRKPVTHTPVHEVNNTYQEAKRTGYTSYIIINKQ